jgi:hypothetical protein
VDIVDLLRIWTGASGDGLGALAFAVSRNVHGIAGERLAFAVVLRVSADSLEGLFESGCRDDS